MKSGIYKLYWDNCDYYYVGQSKNTPKRITGHINCLKKNKHENKKLSDVVKKYGLPKGEVLIFCDVSLLTEIEQRYLDEGKNNKKCCNIVWTAMSCIGHKQKPRSKEHRERLSASLKGKPKSEETKKKLRFANIGKKHSEETKQKMSFINKGRMKSEIHKKNIGIAKTGVALSESHRKNIGKTKIGNTYNKGKKWTSDQIERISKIRKSNLSNCKRFGELNISKRKSVIQIDLITNIVIRKFESMCQVFNELKIDRKSIKKVCEGKNKTAGGFFWQYA